jgi:NAD(P)-dependent dehydrogenase (short-subunit alcohol dehydrogenase family)
VAGYTILVTGANRGLGLALTEKLLNGGHRVCTISRHQSDGLLELQSRFPDTLRRFPGDVTDESSIRAALEAIAEGVQHLDILINNAAVHLEQAAPPIGEADFSGYLPSFEVNSIGPLVVVKHALPLLRKGQGRLIANISSEAGSIGRAWRKAEYSYCMSKAALNMASQLLQNALREEGIKVLAIHPGWFSSDMGGAEAPITPAEAAEPIVATLLHPPDLAGPVFVTSRGEAMDW